MTTRAVRFTLARLLRGPRRRLSRRGRLRSPLLLGRLRTAGVGVPARRMPPAASARSATAPPLPATSSRRPPAVNLSGFPLPYRQGYADGCASATGPNARMRVRFAADGNYRTGWTGRPRRCAGRSETRRAGRRARAMTSPGRAMTPFRSQRVALRGLDHHVLTWGDPTAPKLFLLHGWMDVAASFQFLVDAFARERYVIAPDLRGYGKSAWQPQGYWYADYIADLEALVQAFAPGETVDHRRAQPRRQCRAALRRRASDAGAPRDFARRFRHARGGIGRARRRSSRNGSTRWRSRRISRPTRASTAVADRLQKSNPRLPRDKALFLAAHWAEATCPTGGSASPPTRGTSCRFRRCTGSRRRTRSGAISRRRRCGSRRRTRTSRRWLDDHPEGEGGTDTFAVVRRRFAHIPHGKLVTIPDAGHMLHHDQPAAVAAAMEAFLAE